MKHDGPIPEEWKQRFDAWANEVKERSRAPGELLSYVESTNPQKVSRQGNGEMLMCSPLRSERTPSFRVYPDEHWRDFGLDGGKSGDMLTFVRLFGNLSYRDGLEHMAQLFGIQGWEDRKKTLLGTTSTPLPENLERDMIERWTGDYIEEDTVFAAMTWLAQAAARCLPDQARAHLERHYHLLPKTLEAFAVGYCPAGFWELVTSPEWDCPYAKRTLLSTGWFRQGGLRAEWDLAWDDDTDPTGVITPVFLDRLVFPYWKNGAVRYAIGRQWFGKATKADLAAYLETHAWDAAKYRKVPKKSDTRPYVSAHVKNIVWNEDCLRRARGGVVYITEGITDALLLAQLGLFVISPVTVAFSNDDVITIRGLLKRAGVKTVRIVNDNDETVDKRTGKLRRPGLEGAYKIASALWADGIDVEIVILPKAEETAKVDVNEWCGAQYDDLRAEGRA